DLEALIAAAVPLLAPQAWLFLSLNLESLTADEFRRRAKGALLGSNFAIAKEIPIPFDFKPAPGAEPHLKSAWCRESLSLK
ncbi:MAG TPA: hypothetical protein VJP40_06900, partial [bacterium]|nr:hypothetical protein [bacterium]